MRKSAFLLACVAGTSLAPWQSASAYTQKVLYSFCAEASCADGAFPSGALVMDSSGNLYGTTTNGGAVGATGHRDGVVFELIPNAKHTPLAIQGTA